MKKKVLFVIYSIYGGGAERQMQYILRYIDRMKFEPHLFVFRLFGGEEKLIPRDIHFYRMKECLVPRSFFAIFSLWRLIFKIKPDRIVSFMYPANLVSLFAGWMFGKKVIVGERTHLSTHLRECTFSFLWRPLIKFFYAKSEKITAVSKEVKSDLVKNFGITPEKIEVVRSGVDIPRIRKKMIEADDGSSGFVFTCGNLRKEKDHNFLLEAMALLHGVPLVIAGGGDEKKRRFLENRARELSVNLTLAGFKENPYPLFRKAGVFVLTSRYEGFPNVVLEAMVCGVPVAAVDCPGGIREIITHGETGVLAPPGDKDAFADAIKRIMDDSSFSQRLVKNAENRIKEFDIGTTVKKYEEVILRNG